MKFMKMLKRSFSMLLILIVSLTVISQNIMAATTGFKPNFTIISQGSILINLDSKQVIYEKNADKKMYPASLTKIMTAIVVVENVQDLDKTTATAKSSNFDEFVGIDISTSNIKAGEVMSVRNLLYCLLLESANEGSNILADQVAGSQQKFVEMMN